jgi:hypothetical protein
MLGDLVRAVLERALESELTASSNAFSKSRTAGISFDFASTTT